MGAIAAGRSNAEWLNGLRRQPAEPVVVAELRDVLARGLARALIGRTGAAHADIEDFTQEAMVRVLERLDSFRGESKFTTWALAVAIRVAYTNLRKRRWGDASLSDLGLAADAAPGPVREPHRGAAANVERAEALAALRRAIDEDLTPRQRTAVLAELAGMPAAVLAEQLGINANALYKLHHDARKKLKAALERAGFSAEDVRALGKGATE